MKKILIVDDDFISCELLKNLLKKEFNYDIVYNGDDAIKLFLKNKYDAILMDIKMPIMNGIESTKIIRKYEKENNIDRTPILVITAISHISLDDLFDDVILKPLNYKELITKLKKI